MCVQIPREYRVGLFSEAGTFPAVVRFSDFGADNAQQLARMAVKIPFASVRIKGLMDGWMEEGKERYGRKRRRREKGKRSQPDACLSVCVCMYVCMYIVCCVCVCCFVV